MSATTSSSGGSSGRACRAGSRRPAPGTRTSGRASGRAGRGRGASPGARRVPARQRRPRRPRRSRRPAAGRGGPVRPCRGGPAPALGPDRAGGRASRVARARRCSAPAARWIYANGLNDDLGAHRPVLGDHRRPAGQDGRRRAEHPAGRQRLPGPGRPARQRPASGAPTRSSSCTSRPTTGQGLPGLASPGTCTCRSRRAPSADCGNAERAQDQRGVRVRRAAAGRAHRRVLHRRADRPRDGDRLRRLQGGHRRARRRRPEGRADHHLDPQAVPQVQEGHQPHERRRGARLDPPAQAVPGRATSPGCGTSRSSCGR